MPSTSGGARNVGWGPRRGRPPVVASSAALYGDPESVPIPESHPKNPLAPYGLEKLAVDKYARLYHDLYGLETVALRHFNVYGPRQTGGDYAGVTASRPGPSGAGGRQSSDRPLYFDIFKIQRYSASNLEGCFIVL